MDFSTLKKQFPRIEIYQDHPLAPYTTLKIGGPADIFIHTHSTYEFINILKYINIDVAKEANGAQRSKAISRKESSTGNSFASQFQLTILGNGSNVLISDKGIRGIVIKNSSQNIEIIDTSPISIQFNHTYTQRHENEPEKYLDFTKLDYDESSKPQVLVKISSGTPLPYVINYLIDNGVTGLQWFAYIPGTIGGATWYNIHGGAYHFSDYLESIDCFNLQTGKIETFFKKDLSWSYEKSFFQNHPHLIIISTTLRLFQGDTDMAKNVKNAWIAQKIKVQPTNSAGSVFANPTLKDSTRIWGEQKSTGWIIDHELNWKGKSVGGAQISPLHSNFIVNTGTATATDMSTLIQEIKNEVQKRFKLTLKTEIKFLGKF